MCYNIKTMKILGEPIFARDTEGKLLSRIGTLFLKTSGLVTRNGVHAMQRMMWLDELNSKRKADGLEPLSRAEEEEELSLSVDLIFTDDMVLIRPDPDRVDLAFQADEILQTIVSKRKIRFLNTHSAKVRNALRARGENWRMSRSPISPEDMVKLVERSKVAIHGEPIYYYNSATGTRYLTVGASNLLIPLAGDELKANIKELQTMLSRRNRIGYPELDLFPVTTPIEIKQSIKSLDTETMSVDELKAEIRKIDIQWRMSLPVELREETVENVEWRNAMCQVLTNEPNDTLVKEGDLIQGISPEFYRQIEWLPGARVENGEIIFDPLWEEFDRTHDPELAQICDPRARNIILNLSRVFSEIDYVNVGRIVSSLARDPIAGSRRGNVYIMQCKEVGLPIAHIYMFRFQKWGIAEHLDEGKDLLHAMLEANDYSDYILDRRLMCRQLGMKLPTHVGFGQFTEPYHGNNQYRGTLVRTAYFARSYISGTASDKIPASKYRNPIFALKFAQLMGEAAAVDMIVGRRSTETNENLFDKNYEVIQFDSNGIPARLVVTEHTGSFVDYLHPLEESIEPYANVIRRRLSLVTDPAAFKSAYVAQFEATLASVQSKYRSQRRAFDCLFVNRPFDVAGSGAYRWAKVLERLDKCDPAKVAKSLADAIVL